jgi:hypothetical protein
MKKLLIPFLLLAAAAPARAKDALPFIENDYAAAIAQGKARDLPVFVDAWAPW